MIVKMKKATLLVLAKERQDALKKMREIGVLHVRHVQTPQSEDIDDLKNQLAQAEKALYLLEDIIPEGESGRLQGSEAVGQLLDFVARKDALQTEHEEKIETRKWFDMWGKVSLASIETLENNGISIRCYRTDKTGIKNIPGDYEVQVLDEEKGSVYAVLIARSPNQKLDLREDVMPRVEVTELDKDIQDISQQIKEIQTQILSFACYKEAIASYRDCLRKDIEYQSTLVGLGNSESFVYLQGYLPEESMKQVKEVSDRQGWGYIFEDPNDLAEVPTLLKNSKVPRIIEPLFNFMGTLPGYHEVDVSLIFLAFFSLFYAIIIGDAGYGFVFLAGTFWMRFKNKKAPIEPFALFYVLSITTIIWGTLTGTWFGSRAIAQWPGFRNFIIEPMFSFNESTEATFFMMRFSFVLGLIQLTVAHLIAFKKKLPSSKAFADLGWILICIGMFFVVDLLVLSNPMPGFVIPVFIAGVVVVGIFTKFTLNPLKLLVNFIGAVLNSIQDVISAFSDIVSYIRLFAVGLAGVTVAASFNDMAGGILAPLVLVLGHGLNIILGLMSVMVHGVRLNMLEFSGHLGQEWTGTPYEPFKE